MKGLQRLLFATLISAGCCQEVAAIRAYPYPILMKQPDGTTLLVRIQGDENFHFVTSADGYLLGKDPEGFFRYVDYDKKTGRKTLTAQRAHNATDRTAAERQVLSRLQAATLVNRDLLARKPLTLKAPARTLGRNIVSPVRKVGANGKAEEAHESQYLVILVNFQDSTMRHTRSDFDRWLNEKDYSVNGGTGSVKDYYRDNSMGAFVPNFQVVGPYTLSQPTKYYGENTSDDAASDARPRDMVKEACQLAKADHPELDFSQFDNDGDGEMDNCYIIYAGYSEASTANDDDIWPHSWNMGDEKMEIDGITVNNYSCSAELVGMPGAGAPSMDGIGTFTHEFGHVLGLKDMYDTDSYTNGKGLDPGAYSLYASGSYNNNSHTPPCLMAFERMQMGWMKEGEDIRELNTAEDVTLASIADNKARYINAQPGRAAGTGMEWFILENRQQTGWDKYIPGHGLLITHYDYTDEMVKEYWDVNGPNNNAKHRCMYIVPADNVDDANSRPGDTYPGTSANTSFTDTSRPAARNWDGESLGVPVTNITEDGGQVRFQVKGGATVWNVIKTEIPAEIRDTLATFKADIIHHEVDIDEVGFCWTLGSAEPSLGAAGTSSSPVADIHTPQLTVNTLQPGSNYTVRSYMKLSDGTVAYGSSMPFSTECKTAEAPFVADFTSWTNGQPDCWQITDRNADGTTWVIDESSNAIVYSFDYWNDADDWLISKRRIHVPDNGVLFFTRGVAEETSVENLEVYVSTKSSDIADFNLEQRFSFADYFSQQHMEEVDLSRYAGQDIYIAFRCCSDKMQGDLWLWNVVVTEKLGTPVITRFERTSADCLHAEWTPVKGAARYYLYLGKETDKVNQEALFTPMSFYEDVQGDVSLGTGSIFFKSTGSVTLKTIPDGIEDCKFIVTTSGPVGTSELTVEGTKDGKTWQTVGAKINLKEYDSEGQEVELTSYLKDKKFRKLRFNFKHGGRNGRIKYLTLIYNDGMQYEELASGGVYDTQIDIRSKETGEFDNGKYQIWVAAGDGSLFFDESAPAYYQHTTAIEDVIDGTGIRLVTTPDGLTVSGVKTGYRLTLTSLSGTVLYQDVAQGNTLYMPASGTGSVALLTVEGDGHTYRTKTILK